MQWWRDAKFGMFIHWGIYAVPAGRYNGQEVTTGSGDGEWIMWGAQIPMATYAQYATQFNPTSFNASTWVSIAQAAGMKYIVMTAKHHDGFAMYPSTASSFNVYSASPFHRDPIAEMAAACNAAGIKFGVYYSQNLDWNHPGGGMTFGPAWDSGQLGNYDDYINNVAAPQINEIMSTYHPAILWWDMPGSLSSANYTALTTPLAQVPGIITNDRLGADGFGNYGDFAVSEQTTPSGTVNGDWENCMTINNTWGYKVDDTNFKPSSTLIHTLVEDASKGGNFLLNVGPDATGTIPAAEVSRLQDMGTWLTSNGPSVYATTATPYTSMRFDGRSTVKGSKLYLHVFTWPSTIPLEVAGLQTSVTSAKALATGQSLTVTNVNGTLHISQPTTIDPVDTVIELTLSGAPVVANQNVITPEADGSYILMAMLAILEGQPFGIEGVADTANIWYWENMQDMASWTVSVPTSQFVGNYQVQLQCSVDEGSEGSTFVLQLDGVDTSVTGTIPWTGGSQNYVPLTLSANLNLPSTGNHVIRIRPTSQPGHWVMNLRRMTLIPVAATAPAAPTGLTATAGNTQVSLAWSGSAGASSYNVYRGTTAGGESTTAIATGVTTTSFTNTGLTNGTQYFYKVKAVNSAGTSGYSNEASATPVIVQVAAPSFSPAAGTYTGTQSVTITSSTSGASIRYTTNGTAPTSTTGTVYSAPVSISATSTLKAIAYKSGMSDSAVTSGAYTINAPAQVAAPAFSPAAGTYTGAQSVTITSSTSGASIRYTTNGTAPTSTTGTVYTAPVSISATSTLKAIAYKSGLTDSTVTSGAYIINSGSGTLVNDNAAGVAYTGSWSTSSARGYGDYQDDVHYTTTYNDYVSYTFTGTGIDFITEKYNDEGTVDVYIDNVLQTTVNCYAAARTSQQTVYSATGLSAGSHTIKLVMTGGTYMLVDAFNVTTGVAAQVAAPSFSPAAGTYTSAQSVTIASATSGATIRYTTNGAAPTSTTGTVYSGPVSISATSTLKAIAYKSGMTDSVVTSGTYTINIPVQVAAPTFSPAAGTYTGTQSVTISSATSGAFIRYTTNGTAPTSTTGTVYSGPVSISTSGTLKAIAYKSGSTDSTVTSGAYVIKTMVNDNASGITYTGSWGYSSGRGLGDYLDDVHYTNTYNDYVSYTFTGTGVDFITEKNNDEGNIDIYIDNVLQTTLSCYSATRAVQQTVYSATGLSAGSHTIKVVNRDGLYMLPDAFKVTP